MHPILRAVKSAGQSVGILFAQAGQWVSGAGGWLANWGTGIWSDAPLGSTARDFRNEVGDGRGSALLMACVFWIARTFPEAPLIARRPNADGELEPVPDHPMIALLKRPNPYYSGILLWMATLADWVVTGNAYWLKVRSGAGRVVQLYWVPSAMIEPRWPVDGSVFIDHYDYRPGNVPPIPYDPADVVHFRYGIDPKNIRKGLSPVSSLLREIFTDNEAANYTSSIVGNMGVPGVVISPGDNAAQIGQPSAEAMKTSWKAKFGGDKRGEPVILNSNAKVQVLSFNPQQMDLGTLRRIPEERVSGVLGIPAIVVGFGAGLQRSTFANFKEAREAAYESNIVPTQRLFASDLGLQLLPDFDGRRDTEVAFDVSGVRALQEDENAKWARVTDAMSKGLITRNQARAQIGLDFEPGGDIYYLPKGVTIAPAGVTMGAMWPALVVNELPGKPSGPTPLPKPAADPLTPAPARDAAQMRDDQAPVTA